MVVNFLFVLTCGFVGLALMLLLAMMTGAQIGPMELRSSIGFGLFAGVVALWRHGSAAEVWRRLRRPPGSA